MDSFIHSDANRSTTWHLTKETPVMAYVPTYKLEPKLFLTSTRELKDTGGLRRKGLFKKSNISKPLISVVTVVYNGANSLEQTIQSVLEQTYDNVEYIIVDGGSTDRTIDIIKKYDAQIDYWVSEPDSGIYDAMNKGASLCSGDYVAFLNADDWYNNDTLETVSQMSNNGQMDYIVGNQSVYENDTFVNIFKVDMKHYRRRVPFGHPSLFVKRNLLLEYGFDRKYTIVADYDFMLKIIKKSKNFKSVDISLSNFRLGGVSTTVNTHLELFQVRRSHFGLPYALYTYVLTKLSAIRPYLRFVKKILYGNNSK